METLDPQAVNLAKAIRQTESGGNFQAKGKSGEYGAYQFTEPTWNNTAKKYGVNVPLNQTTKEQQNEVAYKQIKDWKDKGHNVGEIASMWNAGVGEPQAYTGKFSNGKPSGGKDAINSHGVHYDVPAYAKSVATAYQTIKNGGQVNPDPNNPSSVLGNSLTQDTITGDTSNPKEQSAPDQRGVPMKIVDALTFGGASKLSNEVGSSLATGYEKVKGLFGGKDYSQYVPAPDVNNALLGGAGVIAGTGLLASTSLGKNILAKNSLINPAVETGLKRVGLNSKIFETLTTGGKAEALAESLKGASIADKAVIQQSLDKILPQAIKEAGGKVAFSQLHPNLGKILGFVRKGAVNTVATGLGLSGAYGLGKQVGLIK